MKRFVVIAILLLLGSLSGYVLLFRSTTSTTYDFPSGTQGDTTHEVAGVDVPAGLLIVGVVLALGLLAAASWLTVRRRRKASLRCLAVSIGFASMTGAYVCVYKLSILGMGILIPILFFLVPAAFGFGIAWGLNHERRSVALPGAILLSLMPITMALYPWPLHVAFFLSAPFLEQLAEDVEAGRSPELPRWAGVFHIVEVDIQDGRVALITDPNKSGRSGLVRFEPGPPRDEHHYYGPMYNLNWDHKIWGHWRYQNED